MYKQPYYDHLLSCFKSNLLNSEKLIVIGYGFQDQGINFFLNEHYLSLKKRMVIIDIRRPVAGILARYSDQIEFYGEGVTGLTHEQYLTIVQ